MHRLRPRLLALLALPILVVPAAPASAASRDRELSRSIEAAMERADVPGAIVGVWQRGAQPFVRGFGVRDTATRKPMTPDLRMRIGSETKTFTTTALLQLVADGKVSLDDPISKYVPGFPNGDTATLGQLASMTSGIPSYTASEVFYRRWVRDPLRGWTPQQLLSYVKDAEPLFPAGEGFDYSNSNTVLLGLVVEQVSGQPLAEFIHERQLDPLGMRHTAFPDDATFGRPHASGYTRQTPKGRLADATMWNPSWGWAAGAMTSTVRDLRVWAERLASGKGLLPAAVQDVRLASLRGDDEGGAGYGLGMFNANGWLGHNGSLPGYQTVAVHEPKTGTTLVVLVNTDVEAKAGTPVWAVANAVTKIVTPGHVYEVGATPGTSG